MTSLFISLSHHIISDRIISYRESELQPPGGISTIGFPLRHGRLVQLHGGGPVVRRVHRHRCFCFADVLYFGIVPLQQDPKKVLQMS